MSSTSPANLIIDDRAAGLFRVNRRVMVGPEYLDMERERIFANCWIYAGHESEVPLPGDYRSRRVAGRPLIIVRGDDGTVRVLLNTCTHRGALVCREKCGNARTFQCPYHAWTFNTRGDLVGIPGEDSYGPAFKREQLGLVHAPQADSYRGFIFVSFSRTVPRLVDYLTGATEYLDLVCDQSETGMKIVGGAQSYSIRANWKLLAENSIDGYHALPTHQRYFGFLTDCGINLKGELLRRQKAVDLGNGHAVIEYAAPFGRPIAQWIPLFGEERKARIDEIYRALEDRCGAERAGRIAHTCRNLLIFPNLVINDIMAITIRTFFPISPDYMEVDAWALSPMNERPEDLALRLDNFLTFLGPGGFATPDDVEALESCQRGFANPEVEWSDISRGMKRNEPEVSDELQMRTFWRRWHELITAPQARRARKAA
jgi:p-cumate 2,3-dioxygenase subunit alpha